MRGSRLSRVPAREEDIGALFMEQEWSMLIDAMKIYKERLEDQGKPADAQYAEQLFNAMRMAQTKTEETT